jgi:cysteine desulfurase/selenocysteine lyase
MTTVTIPEGMPQYDGVPRFDVERIRADFPILGREVNGRPLIYLDSANTSPSR